MGLPGCKDSTWIMDGDNQRCLKVFPEEKTYQNAKAFCDAQSSTLASLVPSIGKKLKGRYYICKAANWENSFYFIFLKIWQVLILELGWRSLPRKMLLALASNTLTGVFKLLRHQAGPWIKSTKISWSWPPSPGIFPSTAQVASSLYLRVMLRLASFANIQLRLPRLWDLMCQNLSHWWEVSSLLIQMCKHIKMIILSRNIYL